MLDRDPMGDMLRREKRGFELLEHLGEARVKREARAEFTEFGVGRPIDLHAIEEDFHVGEFVVIALLLDKIRAARPKVFGIDSEDRKQRLLLHVGGREGLVVIVNNRDGVLRNAHSGAIV